MNTPRTRKSTAPTEEPVEILQIELPGIGEPESLIARQRLLPPPRGGEATVRMEATGVSFAEQQMRRGKYYDQPSFPFVPGYDLIGTVEQIGSETDPPAGVAKGRRVAVLIKTGAWAERVTVDADDLVPVPEGLDPVDAETMIVNGVTAWRMLHRTARARPGQWIVVLGAAGGVGSLLVQLARDSDLRVIGVGSTAQQETIGELGAVPVDYRTEDVFERVATIAPDGVAAVFDHVGGEGIVDSWRMLARGGTLVAYGSAATKDDPGNPRLPILKLFARLAIWHLLPNGRRARFFNLWAGRRNIRRFRAELRQDLEHVMHLARDGRIAARVARQFALSDAAAALRFAEQGGVNGKVVIVPDELPPKDG